MSSAVSFIDISKLLAAFIVFPIVLELSALAINASEVSETKLKSLVG